MAGYLGIDVGDKRVGVAYLEETVGIAFPQKPLPRASAARTLVQQAKERGVKAIITGLPLTAAGLTTPQAEKVKKFVHQMRMLGLPSQIIYVDEHLSSEDAAERLREINKSVAEARKSGELDCLVAALLLEGYIKGQMPEIKVVT